MSSRGDSLKLPKSPCKSDSEQDLLVDLKHTRGSIKLRLTSFKKYLYNLNVEQIAIDSIKKAELKLRMQSAQESYDAFNKIQCKIELVSDDMKDHTEYRENFEDIYFSCMASAQSLIESNMNDGSNCNSSLTSSIKLPQIKLPSFNGSYDQWLEFKNSYVSMIHMRSDLDAIQKFHYLRSSLSGSAYQVISALEFTALNYSHAWALLENRFNNERLLVHNHIKALFTVPGMNKESPKQIRILIDTILRNLRALKTLNEPTEHWDTLIIYLIASKLDVSTEKEWENYKGSITYATQKDSNPKLKLDDLLTFLRNRADTLEMIHANHTGASSQKSHDNRPHCDIKKPTSQTKLHSFISTRKDSLNKSGSNKRSYNCVACSSNHALYTCPIFLNLTVKDRIKLIDDNKVCRNCLRSGHAIENCLFGPCKHCQSKHNTLLHLGSINNVLLPPIYSMNKESADRDSATTTSTALHSTRTNLNIDSTADESRMLSHSVLLSTALTFKYGRHIFLTLLWTCSLTGSYMHTHFVWGI
ncbi:uncharacterized protein LOC123663677 [Melitaea cinxia]|uniref:uncharacterized protein LOC123663677 n=1 Tax=Melitaea cinxia TaxID=113334 RepID=UPI001E271393|nr:uncharacterized protein LOC123663677 [Melitaea cinxia]